MSTNHVASGSPSKVIPVVPKAGSQAASTDSPKQQDGAAPTNAKDSTAETNESQAKKGRQAPPDAINPQKGRPSVGYGFNVRHGRPDLVPALSKKARRIKLEIATLQPLLRVLAHVVHMKVAFLNYNGGGSKTTTAVNVGNVLAYYTDAVTRVLPASRNPGTTSMKADGAANTLTLLELSEHPEDYATYTESSKAIIKNAAGLGVIRHDSKTRVGETFGSKEFKKVVDTLGPTTDILLMDGGNNSALGAELQAALDADVLVFTCTLLKKPESRLFMGYTMDDFANEPEVAKKGKVEKSIVVFSEVPRGKTAQDYERYATKIIDEKDEETGERSFSGSLVGIPQSDFMASNIIVSIHDLSRDVLHAYLQLGFKMFLTAANAQGIDLVTALRPFGVDFEQECSHLGVSYKPPVAAAPAAATPPTTSAQT